MLKFESMFCSEEKANSMIKKHINDRHIGMMDVELGLFHEGGYDAIDEDDPAFGEYAMQYLPENYDVKKAGRVLLGLYALLTAKDEFIPQLIQEYALSSVIETNIRFLQENGETTVIPMQGQDRAYVLEKIREELAGSDESEEDVKMQMELIEDITYYPETCFWDADYQFLDTYTEEELLDSDLNKFMGIMDKPTNTFEIKPEWLRKGKKDEAGESGS